MYELEVIEKIHNQDLFNDLFDLHCLRKSKSKMAKDVFKKWTNGDLFTLNQWLVNHNVVLYDWFVYNNKSIMKLSFATEADLLEFKLRFM